MILERIESPLLLSAPCVSHGFFTRRGGVSCGAHASLNGKLGIADDPLFVRENRRRVCIALSKRRTEFVACRQTHSAQSLIVAASWSDDSEPAVDALVTRKSGVTLGIMTADCAPVLFVDEAAGVIAAAHAGWRGALSGILESTLSSMERLGARASAVKAAIGPCIWQESYEVSEGFDRPFLADAPSSDRFFKPSKGGGRLLFDLSGYVRARLSAMGLAAVEGSSADTFSDPDRFFSYRRQMLGVDHNAGRQIAAITLIQS